MQCFMICSQSTGWGEGAAHKGNTAQSNFPTGLNEVGSPPKHTATRSSAMAQSLAQPSQRIRKWIHCGLPPGLGKEDTEA